ncbi:hypothetical protein LINPERHAP2_LOCUS11924 [Linum perenne]
MESWKRYHDQRWSKPWLNNEDNFYVSTLMPPELGNIKVSDLMIPLIPDWDDEHVAKIFNERYASVILSTPISCYTNPNRLIWHYSKNDGYTVRSAYRLAMEKLVSRTHLHTPGDWQALCSVKALLK